MNFSPLALNKIPVNHTYILAGYSYAIEMLSGITHVRDETYFSFVNIFDYQVNSIQFILKFSHEL